jgi:Calcineurin-like phosphoesterase
MVSWFNPLVLGATAIRDALAATFGTYADKREQQAALPLPPNPGLANRDELWIDIAADMGEAFDPTHAVLWHMAQPQLEVNGCPTVLPRADLVVLAGDEVYPTGSVDRYEHQTLGPMKAAFPGPPEPHGPQMFALPGNHDWYDGLTSFLRVFCQQRPIGGWRTSQTRSYFSIELAHGWWIWALDTQLGGWLDQPQLDYFAAESEQMVAGDRVLLVVPEPSWCRTHTEPAANVVLDWFRDHYVPDGVTVAAYVTGDNHHYAHYATTNGSEHRITVGGAGAFTHPTHHLPDPIHLTDQFTGAPTTLELGAVFPNRSESFVRAPFVAFMAFLNPVFAGFLGIIQFAAAWLAQASLRRPDETVRSVMRRMNWREAADGLLRSPLALLLAVAIVASWTAFSRLASSPNRIRSYAIGLLHGAAQVAVAVPIMRFVAQITPGRGMWYGLTFALFTVVVGGLTAATLCGCYLLMCNVFFGMHDNEVFSSLRLRSFKSFLRLHLAHDGSMTVYPVGIRHVRSGKWRLRPEGEPGSSWFARPSGVLPELIETPYRLDYPDRLGHSDPHVK